MAATCDHLYSKNFWSSDDTATNLLLNHFHAGNKTIDSLLHFYKERIAIEEEYARKLSNLSRKQSLGEHESEGTLKDSLDTLQEETKQLSMSHSAVATKLNDTLYKPLEDFLSDRRAKGKPTETGVMRLIKQKKSLEAKAEQAKKRYHAQWVKLTNYKTEQILMDEREALRLQIKITKLTQQMIEGRSEYYKLCKDSKLLQDVWKDEWYTSCESLQTFEEEKIKFLKSNIWEYANAVSTACISDDQSCENVRLSLEKCSYRQDIPSFVQEFKTGNTISGPLTFIDYAKGESDSDKPVSVETVQLSEIPLIQEQHQKLVDRKVPPPKPTEKQAIEVDFIDRREETFKQLQEQAQSEAQTRKELTQDTKTESEPSSSKLFSEYSNPTSTSSACADQAEKNLNSSVQDTVYSNPLLNSINSLDKPTAPIRLSQKMASKLASIGNNKMAQDVNPLEAYLTDLKLGGNGSMSKFRESMMSAKGTPDLETVDLTANNRQINTHSTKNSLGGILKNALKQDSMKVKKTEPAQDPELARKLSTVRKSKSSTTLQGKFVNRSNLPSRSSEGYPVMKYCRAQYSYNAEIEQELTFKKKDILMILHQQPDGWWFAENLNTGKSGLAPSNYLVDL